MEILEVGGEGTALRRGEGHPRREERSLSAKEKSWHQRHQERVCLAGLGDGFLVPLSLKK